MKLDPADVAFSLFIRTRDKWTCQRCGTRYTPPTQALQCSHYFGRARENTRYEPDNCDALCTGCHRIWGSDDREAYKQFKIKQLGQRRFDTLTIQANTYKKRDRRMSYLYAKQLLKEWIREEVKHNELDAALRQSNQQNAS